MVGKGSYGSVWFRWPVAGLKGSNESGDDEIAYLERVFEEIAAEMKAEGIMPCLLVVTHNPHCHHCAARVIQGCPLTFQQFCLSPRLRTEQHMIEEYVRELEELEAEAQALAASEVCIGQMSTG